MNQVPFEEALEQILEKDARYAEGAYFFVREGLDYTVRSLDRLKAANKHVTGQELLEGLRAYALEQFGPLAKTVLNRWGIRECLDFGEIVFGLVHAGALGKTEQDSLDDFRGGYDFDAVFREPFQPSAMRRKTMAPTN